MSTPISRRLQVLSDAMDVHDQHHRMLDGRLISITGPLGLIHPFHGEIRVTIERQTSAALVRRLLGLGVLDVAADGGLRLGRVPRPDEAVALRDLLRLTRRRCTP